MAEHLSTLQIENFMTRRLAPGDLTTIARHLAACAECRVRAQAQARTTERVAALQSSLRAEPVTHLSYEQLVAYVEAKALPLEREIISNHLTGCPQCTVEAEELQALRDTLTASPALKSYWAWWRVPALFRPLPIAATAVALLSLLGLVWWLRQPTPQLVSAPVSPPVTASLSPTPAPVAPAVVAALQDHGQTIALDQAGKLTGLSDLPQEAEAALKRALESQQIEIAPAVKKLSRRPATLMGEAEKQPALKLQTPVGTFVNDTRPTFRWQALPAAENYSVQVLDTNFNVVATSPALSQTHWRVTTPLKRGQEYVWQVTAEVEGKRVTSAAANAPEAHFKILSAEQAQALQTLVQTHDSHLLRGTMYAKFGLLDEAEREFHALRQANPQSTVARKLWRNLRALRR